MTDDIKITQDDWVNIPNQCPNCGTEFKKSFSKDERPILKHRYQEGESTHGEYTQIECHTCDLVIQRHYENSRITSKDDPLITPSPWVYRAQILETDTVLKHREAEVQALKEKGKTHTEIAEILDIGESTVGEYSRRITARIEEATRTLEEMGQKIDPLRHIEGQFDGWMVTPSDRWACANCNTELCPGTDAAIVAEFVGANWKPIEIFCTDCMRDDYVTALMGEEINVNKLVEKTREYDITCVIVKGELDIRGEDLIGTSHPLESSDSLTLRDPDVQEVLN